MESYITLSFLNDFVFCPHSIYFHQLYSIYKDHNFKQRSQLLGIAAHEAIDKKVYSTKRSVLQSVEVYSEKYNIVGKIDTYDIEAACLTERKRSINMIYDGYVFQVYAQYFGLLELGYNVKKIFIYDLSRNKKYPIGLPGDNLEMLIKFEKVIDEMQHYNLDDPFIPNVEKCKKCIYANLCDLTLC